MRCGNCMKPEHMHVKRQAAPALCPDYKGVYREATEDQLEAAYNAAFPDGMPEPIDTFQLDNPDDMERMAKLFKPALPPRVTDELVSKIKADLSARITRP